MISTKLETIVMVVPIFRQIMETEFSAADSFRIARVVRELNKEIELFEEKRISLFNKYGTLMKDGARTVQPENIDQFNNEVSELLHINIEINIDKLPISVFSDITMTPQQSLNILDFVE